MFVSVSYASRYRGTVSVEARRRWFGTSWRRLERVARRELALTVRGAHVIRRVRHATPGGREILLSWRRPYETGR